VELRSTQCKEIICLRHLVPFLTARRANVVWHIESQRYFGSQVREIRRILQVEVKPLEEGVVSPFIFRYEDALQERAPSPALTVTSTDEPSLPPASGTVSSNAPAVTIICQARRVNLLAIGRISFQWIVGMLSYLISGPIYFAPLIPLLLLLVLPTLITNGSH
jgi:hypothetical protein